MKNPTSFLVGFLRLRKSGSTPRNLPSYAHPYLAAAAELADAFFVGVGDAGLLHVVPAARARLALANRSVFCVGGLLLCIAIGKDLRLLGTSPQVFKIYHIKICM